MCGNINNINNNINETIILMCNINNSNINDINNNININIWKY